MLKLIAHNGSIKFGSLKYYSYICIINKKDEVGYCTYK